MEYRCKYYKEVTMSQFKTVSFLVVLCLQPLLSYSSQENNGRSKVLAWVSGSIAVPCAVISVYNFYKKNNEQKKVDSLGTQLVTSHLARLEAQQPILTQFLLNDQATIILTLEKEKPVTVSLKAECIEGLALIGGIQDALAKKTITPALVNSVDTSAQRRRALFENANGFAAIEDCPSVLRDGTTFEQAIAREQSWYSSENNVFEDKSEYDRAVKKQIKHSRTAMGSGIIAVVAGGCWLAS